MYTLPNLKAFGVYDCGIPSWYDSYPVRNLLILTQICLYSEYNDIKKLSMNKHIVLSKTTRDYYCCDIHVSLCKLHYLYNYYEMRY